MRFIKELFGMKTLREEGLLRLARIEYTKEYEFLRRSLGREPTGKDVGPILERRH